MHTLSVPDNWYWSDIDFFPFSDPHSGQIIYYYVKVSKAYLRKYDKSSMNHMPEYNII